MYLNYIYLRKYVLTYALTYVKYVTVKLYVSLILYGRFDCIN